MSTASTGGSNVGSVSNFDVGAMCLPTRPGHGHGRSALDWDHIEGGDLVYLLLPALGEVGRSRIENQGTVLAFRPVRFPSLPSVRATNRSCDFHRIRLSRASSPRDYAVRPPVGELATGQ